VGPFKIRGQECISWHDATHVGLAPVCFLLMFPYFFNPENPFFFLLGLIPKHLKNILII